MAVRDPAQRKLSYENYVQIPDDGRRHEIIDGEHYVSPAPSLDHQRLLGRSYRAIANFVDDHQLGEVFIAPVDVLLSPHDIVQPDIFFISTDRLGITTEANVKGAPDLVIEILSASTRHRDETLKRDRYEKLGVREYWILDSWRKAVRVLPRNQHGQFGPSTNLTAAAGDILTTPLLPGLEIPLRNLFR